MAYARFHDPEHWRNLGLKQKWLTNPSTKSDVYVIRDIEGWLECISCPFLGKGFIKLLDERGMLRHLHDHRQHGHKVPKSATRRLKRDIRSLSDHR